MDGWNAQHKHFMVGSRFSPPFSFRVIVFFSHIFHCKISKLHIYLNAENKGKKVRGKFQVSFKLYKKKKIIFQKKKSQKIVHYHISG